MKNKILIILILILSVVLINPINTKALNIKKSKNRTSIELRHSLAENSVQKNCNSLFGNKTNNKSLAWLINQILNYVKIVGPLLVLILSSIDFAKSIIINDDQTLKKSQKKLIIRLIAVVALFFIPTFVQIILDLFGMTDTCSF